MKHISRIKEVSELFHLPASALRYWDDEGLIRFEGQRTTITAVPLPKPCWIYVM